MELTRRGFLTGTLGALFAPGLLACGTDPVAPPDGLHFTARPGEPTRSPTYGMTALGLGGARDGYLYVPQSYTPQKAMPLFVALHGAGGEGASWASYPERAERHGFIVLAPDSRGSTWDLIRGGFGPDVVFLNQALEHVFERCRVDPTHLALGGFSDGASYALSLGVANGDLFSHLVAYSPGFYAPGSPRMGHPRVYVTHGYRDRVLLFTHTEQSIVPDLRGGGYDVTFVPFDGEHAVPAEVSEAALGWFLGAQAPGGPG